MKYLLLLCCGLFSTGLLAQAKVKWVSGIETDNRFTFSVKLDRQRTGELRETFLAIANELAPTKIETDEKAEIATAAGTLLRFDPSRSSLKVKSAKGNQESREEARQWANRIRKDLGLPVPDGAAPEG